MRFFLLFLLLNSALAACSQEDALPEVNANTSFKLAPDNTVRWVNDSQDFLVKVEKIEDSRCPMDATCIWQGEATVTVFIENSLSQTLCIGACQEKNPQAAEAIFRWEGEDYKITLNDVQPYPAASQKQGEKNAVLTIKRVTL